MTWASWPWFKGAWEDALLMIKLPFGLFCGGHYLSQHNTCSCWASYCKTLWTQRRNTGHCFCQAAPQLTSLTDNTQRPAFRHLKIWTHLHIWTSCGWYFVENNFFQLLLFPVLLALMQLSNIHLACQRYFRSSPWKHLRFHQLCVCCLAEWWNVMQWVQQTGHFCKPQHSSCCFYETWNC